MPKNNHILLLASLLFLLLGSHCMASGWQWDERTHNNHKYVTAKSIKEFYRFPQMTVNGNNITLRHSGVKVEFKVNSQEVFMNNVKFILSMPVVKSGNKALISQTDLVKLIDPVLRPNYIAGAGNFNTVVIDPGHGGKDPGAVNKYGTEAYYNLKVAKMLKADLEKRGFKVYMTRSSSRTFLSLSERVKFANKHRNAIFVSIHFNAGGAGRAKGMETFTLSPKGVAHHGRSVRSSDYRVLKGNHQDSQNIALATAIHGSTLDKLKIDDRGIKRARYSVLTNIQIPAILIEGGFMSHPTEALKIHRTSYQQNMAKGISEGIFRYKKALSKRVAKR